MQYIKSPETAYRSTYAHRSRKGNSIVHSWSLRLCPWWKLENPPKLLARLIQIVPRLPLVEQGVQGCRNPVRGQFGQGSAGSAGWSWIMGLSSFLGPFKWSNHPSKTTEGNWVAGSHVKTELGQVRSMFRPFRVDTHPRQSQPGCSPCFSLPLLSLRLLAPFQPYLAITVLTLHFTSSKGRHVSTDMEMSSKVNPWKSSPSQLLVLLSLAAQSVQVLIPTRSVSGESSSRRGKAYSPLRRMEKRPQDRVLSEYLSKVLAHSRVYTALNYLDVAAAVHNVM